MRPSCEDMNVAGMTGTSGCPLHRGTRASGTARRMIAYKTDGTAAVILETEYIQLRYDRPRMAKASLKAVRGRTFTCKGVGAWHGRDENDRARNR